MNFYKILLVAFFTQTLVHAQISRNFNQKEKPIYELGAGTIGLSVPNYPGAKSSTFRTIPFPWVIYRGEFLKADEEGNRLQFLKNDHFEIGFSGGFNFPIDSDDNDARNGMPNTDALIGIGPGLIYRLPTMTNLQRFTFGLGIRSNFAANSNGRLKEHGIIIEPNLRYWVKTSRVSPLTLFGSFSLSLADQNYHSFFYDVESEYKTTDRDEYKSKAGIVDIAASLGLTVDLSKKASMFTGLTYSNLTLSANKKSDLVESQHNIGYVIGFAWMFYEKRLEKN